MHSYHENHARQPDPALQAEEEATNVTADSSESGNKLCITYKFSKKLSCKLQHRCAAAATHEIETMVDKFVVTETLDRCKMFVRKSILPKPGRLTGSATKPASQVANSCFCRVSSSCVTKLVGKPMTSSVATYSYTPSSLTFCLHELRQICDVSSSAIAR